MKIIRALLPVASCLLLVACANEGTAASSPPNTEAAAAPMTGAATPPAYFESHAPPGSVALPPGGANYDWNRVDSAVLDRVNRFDTSVGSIVNAGSSLDKADEALDALADALAVLPGRAGARPAAGVATVIHERADYLRGHLSEQADKRRQIKDALLLAAGAMTTAAAGPYAADPAVGWSVAAFRSAADQIPGSDAVTTNRAFSYDALVKGVAALRSFEAAVARGTVDLS